MKLAPIALLLTLSSAVYAQQKFTDPANLGGERVQPRDGRELPVDRGAAGLQQLLRKLNTRASILNIVAHPDDEDGGMLTFYARGMGARVADLSLTRGEGGQNAMTGDFEDALGLLRTQELLANDRYTGVDQMFGTEVDFGFSKTKEEAFAKWTHERVLYDVVRAVRIYRPLVITATFIGGVTDGHGQHQVSGEIAQEAFKAAGDPKVFPELTAEGILPWQPLKVYARVPTQSISEKGLYDYATGKYTAPRFTNYVTGEVTTTTPSVDVIVHEGTPDTLLDGKTYVQFARLGLSQQKSQMGPGGRMAPSGAFDVGYHLYGTQLTNQSAYEDTFFTGIDVSLTGIASLATSDPALLQADLQNIQATLTDAATRFDNAHPEAIAPALAGALTSMRNLAQQVRASKLPAEQKLSVLRELGVKIVQANDALALAVGVTLEAQIEANEQPAEPYTFTTASVSPQRTLGSSVHILSVVKSGTLPIIVGPAEMEAPGAVINIEHMGIPLAPNAQHVFQDTVPVRNDPALITRPYFSRSNIEQPVYDLLDTGLRNASQDPAAFSIKYEIAYGGTSIQVRSVVRAANQAVNVVPPISVSLSNHAQVLPSSEKSFYVRLLEESLSPQQNIHSESLGEPASWKLIPTACSACPLGATDFGFEVPFAGRTPKTLHAAVTLDDNQRYEEGYHAVGYGDLPRTNYFLPATDRIVPVDLKLPERHRIGYVAGTGDAVPEALLSIGIGVQMLNPHDLTPPVLKDFDTVILGVRTYAAYPELHGAPTQALLDYARAGGNVVVQYQTMEFTGDDAPYPLALGSNEKVVDENAPVRLFTAPGSQTHGSSPGPDLSSQLLSTPNKLTSADFNGWIEERGHGFLSTWDPHYSAPTETHDPEQDPQRGGLITVKLGGDPNHQGRWTYCAFAIYRQLPEAVPGAYRFFLNLLNPE